MKVCLFIFVTLVPSALASMGDRTQFNQHCLTDCFHSNCTATGQVKNSFCDWPCKDECRYECMWKTVNMFQENDFPIPQFHGKWPFVRFCGIQEPASALFSVFNLVPHVILLRKFRREIHHTSPMFKVWTMYGLVSINTWTWSAIFHSRDTDFTEMMDYFCAFSIVSYNLMAFFIRLFGNANIKSKISVSACIFGFFYHIYNMAFVRFDYGYNMIVNISVGALNSVCWLAWCFLKRKEQGYVWKAATSVLLLNLSISLELLEFTPFLWTFDSHSLWHLSTAPIHFLWYDFIIDDCKYLMKKRKDENEDFAKKLE